MQLKNNLYTITNKEVDGLEGRFTIEVNSSHFIYQSHFPGEPITPGVCIVQIGKELLELFLREYSPENVEYEITKVKNVKFLSVISPRETRTIVYNMKIVEISEDRAEVRAQMVVTSEDEAKTKISLLLKATC